MNDSARALLRKQLYGMKRGGALIAMSMTPWERSLRSKKAAATRNRGKIKRVELRRNVSAKKPSGVTDRVFGSDQVALFAGGSAERHLVRTKGGYTFTPDRQRIHQSIADEMLAGKQPSQRPRMIMMGGGPAAGKSTMNVATDGSVLVDSDEVKKGLPEFGEMLRSGDTGAAAFVHEESSYLAKSILQESFDRRFDVVMDGTGDSAVDSVRRKIEAARSAGYVVSASYVTCDTDAAVQRALKRGSRTGRIVPESVIRHTHATVSSVFPQVIDDFDEITLFDNNGTEAVVIARKALGGKFEVLDPVKYQAFLDKAKEA